jgi:dienelactone hydrolase
MLQKSKILTKNDAHPKVPEKENRMRTETKNYYCGATKHQGYYAYPDGPNEPRPVVIVAHAWLGQDNFARQKAEELAKLGYIGFAADIYGEGITASNADEAQKLMLPLFFDRKLLQERMIAAFKEVDENPLVDSKKIGVIGFCFGGLATIELFRSGTPILGAVSFHAVLSNHLGDHKAKTVPIAKNIKGSLLMLHGYNDPSVKAEDVQHIQHDLDQAHVDWQMNIYGQTVHAFTNPEAHDHENGRVYNPETTRRAWRSMQNFFHDIFSKK